jgi:hypothetical protein
MTWDQVVNWLILPGVGTVILCAAGIIGAVPGSRPSGGN